MAGTMRKMAVYLGLVEDQDRYDGDAYDEQYDDAYSGPYDESADYDVDERPDERGDKQPASRAVARGQERRPVRAGANPPVRRERTLSAGELSRITTLHPRTYNEARTIGEHFRSGTPVIMNLTEMDDNDAKRLVDFAAGLIFGLHGSIERVTQKVFLLSPANVSVAAEDKARIAEGGFFNQS